MTMPPPAPDPLLPNLPENYSVAWMLDHDRSEAMRMMRRGFQDLVDECMPKVEAMARALGIRKQPNRLKRLAGYLVREEWKWEFQRLRFPSRYAAQWSDFMDLREAAERGDFQDADDGEAEYGMEVVGGV